MNEKEKLKEFVAYYRMLNEYVILCELLYAGNDSEQYLSFIDIYQDLITDTVQYSDEKFMAAIESAKIELKEGYIALIERYFTLSISNYSYHIKSNKKATEAYEAITNHIIDIEIVDIKYLVNCIENIERAIPMFTSMVNR